MLFRPFASEILGLFSVLENRDELLSHMNSSKGISIYYTNIIFSSYFLGSENGGKNNASDLKKMANFKAPLKLHFSGESTPTTNLLVLNEVVIDRGKFFIVSKEFDKNFSK